MCHFIDVAEPGDTRVAFKEMEEIQKYQDLARELCKIWQVKVVVGALGIIPKGFQSIWEKSRWGTTVRVDLLQKAILLGTPRILSKTLEIEGYRM